ncbi:GerMN domain-containing protein [Paenibacillus lemnae]|uniref:GerMN domain-containing protein n=1 Tax=Paenibacillus lemnae TaxID=1330551 RepID=A0A848MCS5_PAELE|nr:GerMN domain-containing protein [Paenibacillus lemnae]NMO97981.1 GerMN domain-containing protein [Paenibacillus lemnae]
MNKKIWSAALLAAVMLLGTACGDKPGAAPAPTEDNNQEPAVTTPAEPSEEPETPADSETPDSSNGAGGGDSTAGGGGSSQTDSPDNSASPDNTAVEPEEKTETIKVYYTDPDAMELLEGSADIQYEDEKSKLEAAFKALQTSDSDEQYPLWQNIELLSLTFEDGALTLDLHIPDTANMGSGVEAFAMDALKQTYFQFDEVQSIQLLVDGSQVESLMGHVSLNNPETR